MTLVYIPPRKTTNQDYWLAVLGQRKLGRVISLKKSAKTQKHTEAEGNAVNTSQKPVSTILECSSLQTRIVRELYDDKFHVISSRCFKLSKKAITKDVGRIACGSPNISSKLIKETGEYVTIEFVLSTHTVPSTSATKPY